MLLSILIPTTPRRLETYFPKLIRSFEEQIAKAGHSEEIEVLGLYDNKKRCVGAKRNALMSIANGAFLTFIDDDDSVPNYYLEMVTSTIKANPDVDVICYDCVTTVNGGDKTYSKYSINYEYSQTKEGEWLQWRGKPAHTMVWRSEIAKKHLFPEKNYGEDVDWVVRACADVKKEVQINEVLYYYDFRSDVSETR